jgi:hypothetical protein
MMVLPKAEEVYQLADTVSELMEDDIAGLPAGWMQAAIKAIKHHRVEIRLRLSAAPGLDPLDGGLPGAHPKQVQVVDDFLSGRYRLLSCYGANRSGKTVGLWEGAFCYHLRERAVDGETYWAIAPNFTKLRTGPHKWLWDTLPREMFGDSTYTPANGFGTNQILSLKLPEGRGQCNVVWKTEDQDLSSFESDSVTGVAWTEASREAVFDSLWARLVDTGGWLLMDYVPLEEWHKSRVRLSTNPRWKAVRFAMQDNAHNLPPNAIPEARENMSDRDAKIRIDGYEGAEFGSVYRDFDPTRHVIPTFALTVSMKKALYRTYDYGFASPAACVWVSYLPSGFVMPAAAGEIWGGVELDHDLVVVYREFFEREHTVPQQAASITSMSEGETYRFNNRIVVDPTIFNRTPNPMAGKGKPIAKMFAEHGIEAKRGKQGKGADKDAQVARVQWWFANDKILVMDNCKNFIREHEAWKYKKDRDGNVVPGERYEDKDDHTCDCFRYLLSENLAYDSHGTTAMVGQGDY